MSQHWHDRDLLEWTQKTLPEFLLVSMQDPCAGDQVIAVTPWEHFEMSVKEVQVTGEASLSGRHGRALLCFDLDLGLRLSIQRRRTKQPGLEQPSWGKGEMSGGGGAQEVWPCIAHITHFENCSMTPQVSPNFEPGQGATPPTVADEVGWYLKEGMGRRYIWYALARWHSFAVRKWTDSPAPVLEDPYSQPDVPPQVPPFKMRVPTSNQGKSAPSSATSKARTNKEQDSLSKSLQIDQSTRHMQAGEARKGPSSCDLAASSDEEPGGEEGWVLDPVTMSFRRKGSAHRAKRFRRYPYLPSVLAGVAGPSVGTVPVQEDEGSASTASSRLIPTRSAGKISALDLLMDQGRRKKKELEALSSMSLAAGRATELCDAITKGEVIKAFSRMDEESTNCAHPRTGKYAVHCCVETYQKELLQMVVEAKAVVNVKDRDGQTPLMIAAKQQSPDLAKVLLDAGADATVTDASGHTASDMVKPAPQPDYANPLQNWRERAAGGPIPESEAKRRENLKTMIEDKERPKKYGAMLLTALEQKDARTAESAIEAGGDVNAVDAKGDSPLLLLAKGKWKGQETAQVRLMEKAHKAGALVNARNNQGNTPLLYAAFRGTPSAVEALLHLKADVDAANKEGSTALMYGAHGGHEAICTMLLEHFAQPSMKNASKLTAEQIAQKRGFRSCAILIQAYELAPKKRSEGEAIEAAPKKKEVKEKSKQAFDYSKWDALEKEMAEDEAIEDSIRQQEANAAMQKKPQWKLEDMGPEAFGLPPGTPWPPVQGQPSQKGPFDYSRWDKIVGDMEKEEKAMERYEHLQKNPQYEWRDGQKMRVIY